MFQLLRHPVFGRLLLSHILALLGTGLATIALGFVAFDIAGDKAGSVLGTVLAIKMLCFMLVAPIAATLLARTPVKVILLSSELIRVAVAACLPFVTNVWHIYALVVIMHVASAVFTPTFQAAIPRIITNEQDYGRALALSRMAYDLETLVSPLLTGVLLLLVSAQDLFFGTAIGLAASAALIASLILPRPAPAHQEIGGFGARLTRGSQLLFSSRALRGIFMLHLAVAGSGGFAMVQTVTVVRGSLGLEESDVALALGAMGVGSLCGALFVTRNVERFGARKVLLTGGLLLGLAPLGVPLALFIGGRWGLSVLMALWIVLGIGYSTTLTPIGQVIRATIGDSDLPSVFAAQFSLAHGWWLVAYLLAGWLGTFTSMSLTAVLLGLVSLMAALLARSTWRVEVVQSTHALARE